MTDVLLQADDLRYRYDDGTVALRGLSLTVTSGERVGLVGPNGSGKSTLLLCLAGLLKPQGTVRVDGREPGVSSASGGRGRIGLIFQSPDDQLFMPTLADDIAFGPINLGLPAAAVRQRVQESAAPLHLADLLDRPPHHLSMGQKRIAAIATVLAMRPAVLLMDEPSSNLDARSRRRVIDVLQGLTTSLLVASHDLGLIERACSRVLVIDDGRIVEEGVAGTILHDAALMERYGLLA